MKRQFPHSFHTRKLGEMTVYYVVEFHKCTKKLLLTYFRAFSFYNTWKHQKTRDYKKGASDWNGLRSSSSHILGQIFYASMKYPRASFHRCSKKSCSFFKKLSGKYLSQSPLLNKVADLKKDHITDFYLWILQELILRKPETGKWMTKLEMGQGIQEWTK